MDVADLIFLNWMICLDVYFGMDGEDMERVLACSLPGR